MKTSKKQVYGSFRLRPETLDSLRDAKIAFESSYLRHFTNDELIHKLLDCVEDAEPAVWENYAIILMKKEEHVL